MEVIISARSKQLLESARFHSILKLPPMSNAEYDELKYLIEFIGGHWKEKIKGFVFDDSAENIQTKIDKLKQTKSITLSDQVVYKIKNQFYPTPDWLAYEMVKAANIDNPDLSVLEPSAGDGAILKYIRPLCNNIHAVELNRKKAELLRSMGFRVSNRSFEDYASKTHNKFDRIIMNPPYANEMDLRHTALAYNLLKPGGVITSLVAENSLYYDRNVTDKFNRFIREFKWNIVEIPHGTFKESGTNVDVVALLGRKIDNTEFNLS